MREHAIADDRPEDRDGFRFRGGSAAIDLTATLQARLTAVPRELLAEPGDLDRWLTSAGRAQSSSSAAEADLATARALREAIFALAERRVGSAFDSDARNTLNRIAAAPAASPFLREGGGMGLRGSTAELLASLAGDAVRLFGGETAAHIRQCQAPNCSIFFVDTSRSSDRRWCSMAACGNKAKVAEFRRRKRASLADE